MYTLIRSISIRQFLLEQAPTIGVSLFIAELFYKFHSFTLECVAFFATWYGIDVLRNYIKHVWIKAPSE